VDASLIGRLVFADLVTVSISVQGDVRLWIVEIGSSHRESPDVSDLSAGESCSRPPRC